MIRFFRFIKSKLKMSSYDHMQQLLEESKNQPFIGDIERLESLESEYADNPNYTTKLRACEESHPTFRSVRRDGNCFYRSYMFGVLEAASLDTSNTLADTLLKTMEAGFQLCLEMGAPEFTLEDFYEVMVEQLTWIREEHPSSDEIAERFRDQYVSDYAVFYARAMVAGYLRKNKDMFAPYIDQSIDTFIRSSVEPMNTDADYVQCVALANTLNIGVRIMYVDQAPGNLNSHTFPEGATPLVFLLYRPGHYDVLYSKQKEGKTDATGSKTDAGASTEKTIETDTSGGGTDTGTNTETEKKDETDTSGERGTSDDRDNDNKVEDRADGTNDATCVLSGAVASLYLDE